MESFGDCLDSSRSASRWQKPTQLERLAGWIPKSCVASRVIDMLSLQVGERSLRTFQDRLIAELRLAWVTTMEGASRFPTCPCRAITAFFAGGLEERCAQHATSVDRSAPGIIDPDAAA
jgi:hypothetical protein